MNQLKYIICLTCDYEEYLMEIDFVAHFSNAEKAKEFASIYVHGIELSHSGIKILAEQTTVSSVVCRCCKFKKVKNKSMEKAIIDIDEDYLTIDCDVPALYNQLCLEYGARNSFFFSNSGYAVKEY